MVEAGTDNSAIDISLRRHRTGIRIQVKVWPEVEEFFRHWSAGNTERPQFGRLWRPIDGAEQPTVWSLSQNFGMTPTQPYSVTHSGGALTVDHGFVNISYLRLVGASAPEGRTIIVEAVIGKSELNTLAQRISGACHSFYSEYLQPVNLRAFVGVHALPAPVGMPECKAA